MLRKQVLKPRLRPVWNGVLTAVVFITAPALAAFGAIGLALTLDSIWPIEVPVEAPVIRMSVTEDIDPPATRLSRWTGEPQWLGEPLQTYVFYGDYNGQPVFTVEPRTTTIVGKLVVKGEHGETFLFDPATGEMSWTR